jgi:hypothetical protein
MRVEPRSESRIESVSHESAAPNLGDKNLDRLWALLSRDGGTAVTISTLAAAGITAPAQAIYMLQLRGCEIERVHTPNAAGGGSSSYRMRIASDSSEVESQVDPRHGATALKRIRMKIVISEA